MLLEKRCHAFFYIAKVAEQPFYLNRRSRKRRRDWLRRAAPMKARAEKADPLG
jgi:hypothetical protein